MSEEKRERTDGGTSGDVVDIEHNFFNQSTSLLVTHGERGKAYFATPTSTELWIPRKKEPSGWAEKRSAKRKVAQQAMPPFFLPSPRPPTP